MRTLIAGIGGVGGYFGGRMVEAGVDVTFLARGKNAKALREKGIKIESPDGDYSGSVKVIDLAEKSPNSFDVVLVCVKTYQTQSLIESLKDLIDSNTLVISLQNGIDRHRPWTEAFDGDQVAGGLCYLGAHLHQVAWVKHVAAGKIIVGPLKQTAVKFKDRLHQWAQDLKAAGLTIEETDAVKERQWQKWLWNIGFNGPTAILDVSVGDLLSRPEQRILVWHLMNEGVGLARLKGVSLEDNLADQIIAYSERELADVETSMLMDRRRNRPLEWQIFYGYASQQSHQKNHPTPMNDLVGDLLKAFSPRDS